MSIDTLGQSGKNIPLPEDIKAHLENAKNNVTLMQAEAERLQKLAAQATDVVNQKHIEKNTLETKIDKLTEDAETLIKSVADRKVDLTMLEQKAFSAQKVLEDTRNESLAIIAAHTGRSAELDKREEEVKAYEENINQRSQALLKKEGDHAARVEKLQKAIE